MIMRKETLVFLTSLAIIFIIGYVNMTMTPENIFNEEDYAQFEKDVQSDVTNKDIAEFLEDETEQPKTGLELVEVLEQTDTTDMAVNQPADTAEVTESEEPQDVASEEPQDVALEEAAATEVEEETGVILGDITDIINESVVASSEGIFDMLNSSFANFKVNKEKGNQDVIDHLEKSLTNESISADTKGQFEALLLNKNEFVEAEKDIELMLQTKGYNETIVIVDSDMVKVVTNDKIEQADATKILDVIVSETNYEPAQIKIVKFDNIDL